MNFISHMRLVISNAEGVATKWENPGSETFYTPPQNFSCPPFKEWKPF